MKYPLAAPAAHRIFSSRPAADAAPTPSRQLLIIACLAFTGILFGHSPVLSQGCPGELKNVYSTDVPDSVTVCPAGDSVSVSPARPSRVRMVIRYLGPPCNTPRSGVPPESIWVQVTTPGDSLKVWNEPLRIFADDSTDANGYARVTVPSISGAGRLRLAAYVSGEAKDSVTIQVRSTDSNRDGRTTTADLAGCDLDWNGTYGDLADQGALTDHVDHWHRHALFGTPVRRTPYCSGCSEDQPGTVGDSEVTWSPNGTYLAHSMFVSTGVDTTDCHIFINPSDPHDGGLSVSGGTITTTGAAREFSSPPHGLHDYDPNWSPLGNLIAYDRHDNTIIIKGTGAGATENIVATGQRGISQVGANMPAVSPNGEWLAYTDVDPVDGFGELWIVSLRDTSVRVKVVDHIQVSYPQWSPNGHWVFYHVNYDDAGGHRSRAEKARADLGALQTSVAVFNAAATQGSFPGITKQPAVAPDSLVAAAAYGASEIGIRTFDPEGAASQGGVPNYQPYVLYGKATVQPNPSVSPRWSPDGTRTAFRASPPYPAAPGDDLPEIWAVRRNMSLPPRITSVGGHAIVDSLPYLDVTVNACGVTFTMTVSATDPEGDPLTYGAAFLHGNMSFDPSTHVFSWPSPESLGYGGTVKFFVTTPSGGTGYALVRFNVEECPGGCPVAEIQTEKGWTAENTILGRSTPGAPLTDAYRVKAVPLVTNGCYALRIRENEQEVTSLDEASLLAVDHPAKTQVFWMNNSFVCGTPEGVTHVRTTRGVDVTDLVSGGSTLGFAGGPGDTLLIERAALGAAPNEKHPVQMRPENDGDSTGFILDGGHKEGGPIAKPGWKKTNPPAYIDSQILTDTGILLQARDSVGAWQTVAHYYPREDFDEAAFKVPASGELRLVFIGNHNIRYVGELVTSDVVEPAVLPLVRATHSTDGDVLSGLSSVDAAMTSIAPGDTVSLEYSATPVAEGVVRDFYLYTTGLYTSTGGLSLTSTGQLPWHYELSRTANPVRGEVRFSYTMAQRGAVSIRVYDVRGRLIRTLVDGTVDAGPHAEVWDARDARGTRVPAGVYLYQMASSDWKAQRKVLLLNK